MLVSLQERSRIVSVHTCCSMKDLLAALRNYFPDQLNDSEEIL